MVAELFEVLRDEYDYVVVDLPRALVDWIEPVIKCTTRLIVVADTSVPSVRHSRRLIDFYREANLGLSVELVANHETRPMFRGPALKAAENALGARFDHWIPDNPKLARKAIDVGHPIAESYAKSNLGKAFRKIASAIRTSAPINAANTSTAGQGAS
jgi:Flp pilus assembly CpaE family ATPase